jgi:hypothetical protein
LERRRKQCTGNKFVYSLLLDLSTSCDSYLRRDILVFDFPCKVISPQALYSGVSNALVFQLTCAL